MEIPSYAKKAIQMIEQSGFEAYLVGGCVRDILMQKIPNDIDITTNMLPDEIEELFVTYKTLDVGKKHGTITVFIENNPIEITTYRIESGYDDNRHPQNVSFTRKLEDDLARRDFTINAICYNEKTGYVDMFEGISDIQKRLIRAIGVPENRFNEDALRILRAFRFSAQFGFAIDEDTKSAIYKCRHLLNNISTERITVEINKMMMAKNPVPVLDMMNEMGILNGILKPLSDMDKKAIENAKPIYELRASLCLTTKGIDTLCINSKTKLIIKRLMEHTGDTVGNDKPFIKRKMNEMSYEVFMLLLEYKAAFGEDTSAQKNTVEGIIRNSECYMLSQLAVNGNDLIEYGIKQGKEIKSALEFLLDSVIDEKVENEKKALINRLPRLQLRGTPKG